MTVGRWNRHLNAIVIHVLNVRIRNPFPVDASQSRAVLSQLPVTIHWPSREKAADVTRLLCPRSVSVSMALEASLAESTG